MSTSKFNVALSGRSIAGQIAALLNSNNELRKTHNIDTVLSNGVQYFIELNGDLVVGCVGLFKQHMMDKVVHLSVSNSFRRRGIGLKLINTVINSTNQQTLYTQVRQDNVSSLNLMHKAGFSEIAYIPKGHYNIITLLRRKNAWL